MGVPHLRTKLPFSKNIVNSANSGFFKINQIENGGLPNFSFGNVIKFNDTLNPYAYIAIDGDTFKPTTEFTFSVWLKGITGSDATNNEWVDAHANGGLLHLVQWLETGSQDDNIKVRLRSSGADLVFDINPFSNADVGFYHTFSDTSAANIGGWNHLCVVFNNNSSPKARLYLNNIELSLISSRGGAVLQPPGVNVPIVIRGEKGSNISSPSGDNFQTNNNVWLFDDWALWDADLSGSVASIYNNGTPPDLSSFNPSIWLQFNANDTLANIANAGSLSVTGAVINGGGGKVEFVDGSL